MFFKLVTVTDTRFAVGNIGNGVARVEDDVTRLNENVMKLGDTIHQDMSNLTSRVTLLVAPSKVKATTTATSSLSW
jgi:hypothetical protein